MNNYCSIGLHQIEIAISSILKIIEQLDEKELDQRPTNGKYSIRELISHISLICKADYFISMGKSIEEMSMYYEIATQTTLENMKSELLNNFAFLQDEVTKLDEGELFEKKTSYWGVTYTRYEWLLEILAHLYHHRGQLHAILVHCCQKKINCRII